MENGMHFICNSDLISFEKATYD